MHREYILPLLLAMFVPGCAKKSKSGSSSAPAAESPSGTSTETEDEDPADETKPVVVNFEAFAVNLSLSLREGVSDLARKTGDGEFQLTAKVKVKDDDQKDVFAP